MGEAVVAVGSDRSGSEPESGSFDDVYRRESAPMVRLAYLMVDSETQAEEVVHDAFATLYERWSRVDNPGAYLRTCVVNRCNDVHRRRALERRWRQRPADEHAELGADHLLDALERLPLKRRAALVLRYYDDRTVADIAEILGVRPGTVKSMLHRGLAQLREAIEPEEMRR